MRHYFPILKDNNMFFFDSAASAQKPAIVLNTIDNIYRTYYSNIHRGLYQWASQITADYENAREKVQRFLGAKKPNEIIFTRSGTESINLVAYSYGRTFLHEGDHILLSILEHHANIVPWQILAQEKHLIIDVVYIDHQGDIDWIDFANKLTPKTRLVALTHISNVLGTCIDIKKAAHLAHQVGAKILIDGTQGAVHKKVNVEDFNVDFYVITGHKLYGPTGIGALYIRSDVAITMPPFLTGGDMVKHVSFKHTTFTDPPSRFEAGTPPIIEAIGLGLAVDFITNIGWDSIYKKEQDVFRLLVDSLSSVPNLRFLTSTKNKAPIISFFVEGFSSVDIALLLGEQNVCVRAGHHCAEPLMQYLGIQDTVRASIAMYNEKREVEVFLHALQKALKILS